jgi:hypothetical protein
VGYPGPDRRAAILMGNYVKDNYGVPAEVGVRVTCNGKPGTITGFVGQYLAVKIDGEPRATPWHPTWRVTYHTPDGDYVTGD